MTTSTVDFEPRVGDLNYLLYPNGLPDPPPEFTVVDNGDGTWSLTVPDEIPQETLDQVLADNRISMIQITNMLALFEKFVTYIPLNRAFLDNPAPTAEDNAAQIKALTRQINGLLIMRGGDFLDISGT